MQLNEIKTKLEKVGMRILLCRTNTADSSDSDDGGEGAARRRPKIKRNKLQKRTQPITVWLDPVLAAELRAGVRGGAAGTADTAAGAGAGAAAAAVTDGQQQQGSLGDASRARLSDIQEEGERGAETQREFRARHGVGVKPRHSIRGGELLPSVEKGPAV